MLYNEVNQLYVYTSGSVVKNPPSNAGDEGSIPGSGRYPGEENGNLLQYSGLGNPMDRGAWQATVHGVADSWIWLCDWEPTYTRPLTFGLPFYPSHPTPLGHHRTPSRAPCAMQQIPTSCFTHGSAICPTSSPNSSSPSHCVHTSILYICIPTLAMGLSSSVM